MKQSNDKNKFGKENKVSNTEQCGRCSTSLSMINSEYFGLLIRISVQIIIYWLVRRENRNQQSRQSTSTDWREENKFKLMLGYRIF